MVVKETPLAKTERPSYRDEKMFLILKYLRKIEGSKTRGELREILGEFYTEVSRLTLKKWWNDKLNK